MRTIKLKDVATILLSNVDKKSFDTEIDVLLCNFTDVYYNWAITKNMTSDFMKATANQKEIKRFTICKGDVAITKDSETRYDIGSSTYIADDVDNVLLGYHCALIRPNPQLLSGKYLNALFHSEYAKKYFANAAGGSGQRYTLTLDAIENFPVPAISLTEQIKIGTCLNNIDQQIQRNNEMVHKLQDMAQATYSRWFNQFEYPNNNEEKLFNEQLGREIPKSWNVLSLSDCVSLNTRGISQVEDPNKQIVPVINQKCIRNGNILMSEIYWHNNDNCLSTYKLLFMDVLVNSMGTGTLGRISPFVINEICVPHSCVTLLRINKLTIVSKAYLYLTMKQMEQKITSMGTGSTGQTSLNNSELAKIKIMVPSITIQTKFEQCVLPLFEQLQRINMETMKLVELKRTILPLLINGQLNI